MSLLPVKKSTTIWTGWIAAVLVAAITFGALFPTLKWTEFTGGNENIVVQTALEMRHGGPILVPQMMGEPRIKKPPLVAWITALTMQPETISQLDHPKLHHQAYRDLSLQVRWTGLLAGCLLILATYALARELFDSHLGIFAAIVVATNILFQKYMRQSTSDVHLALWVTIANLFFARAIFGKQITLSLSLAAIASAIAFLCKGPVALAETLVPAIAMFFVTGRSLKNAQFSLIFRSVVIFAVIALPWFAYVYFTVPNVMQTWFSEVSRHGATDLEPSHPAMYLLIIPMFWPWVVMMVGGAIVMVREKLKSDWYAILMLMLPLAIMIWFPDRKERYLLPLIAPAAIICARGMLAFLELPTQDKTARWIAVVHYILLAGISVALPVAASIHSAFLSVDGKHWFEMKLAVWFVVILACVIGLGILYQSRYRASLIISTFFTMLILQAIIMFGYRDSESGRSPMKKLADYIRYAAPDAVVYDWNANGRRVDEDLPIYLNQTVRFADPKDLKMTGRSVVYVTRQSGKDQEAGIEPKPPENAGWYFLTKVKERKNQWWAFILPSPQIQP